MKKINLEKLLYIFIILLPILDVSSFLFRSYFNINFSPSTFLRPIIPIVVFFIIFLKKKFKLKILVVALIYGLYAFIHLYLFNRLKAGISYGTIAHELQYLINYTFGIFNLFIFIFVFSKNDFNKISKSILISNGIYLLFIYISLFTRTSSTTYIEGIGLKGWFESGNSLSAILVLNLFVILTLFNKHQNRTIKIFSLIEFILSGIFLCFFIGTRTALFGFALVFGFYILSKIFVIFRDAWVSPNRKLNKNAKTLLIISVCFIILILAFILLKGSSILSRRKYLKSIENNIYDEQTGNPSHVTGDILNFKEQIELNNISEDYIPRASQNSILKLYSYANAHNISSTNRRYQQLVYNWYLVKEQSNIFYILFGNGFLNNYGELILEMEIPALLFNFGLIGFILYFIPFLSLFIYYTYIGIKNIKIIDSEYIILVFADLLSFVLSFLLGQIFFNSSAVIVIVCINVILYNKCAKLQSSNSTEIRLLPIPESDLIKL